MAQLPLALGFAPERFHAARAAGGDPIDLRVHRDGPREPWRVEFTTDGESWQLCSAGACETSWFKRKTFAVAFAQHVRNTLGEFMPSCHVGERGMSYEQRQSIRHRLTDLLRAEADGEREVPAA